MVGWSSKGGGGGLNKFSDPCRPRPTGRARERARPPRRTQLREIDCGGTTERNDDDDEGRFWQFSSDSAIAAQKKEEEEEQQQQRGREWTREIWKEKERGIEKGISPERRGGDPVL